MAQITLDAIRAAAAKAGESTAAGNDGIFHLGKIIFMGTRAGVVKTTKGDTAISEAYKVYLRAANQSQFGAKVDVDNDKALKFGVAKLRVFAHFAGLKGKNADAIYSLVPRSVSIINAQANAGDRVEKKVGSRYEQVLRVLRYATKVAKKANLSDDEIADALAPRETDRDEAHIALKALQAKAKKFAEAIETPAIAAMFAAIESECAEQLAKYEAAFAKASAEIEGDDDEDLDLEADEDLLLGEAA